MEAWEEFTQRHQNLGGRELALRILYRLHELGETMSDLAAEQAIEDQAITDLGTRISTITGPLQAALDNANAQVAALTTDDQAGKDALAAALTEATSQVAALNALAQPTP